MLKAHHRRGDRDAALGSTAIQSERTRRRSPRTVTSPASWITPPNIPFSEGAGCVCDMI
jgi:hypothetical protein